MNKILDKIYWHYKEMPTSETLLETPETQRALGSFFNAYFGHFSYDEHEQAWHELACIISAYQKRAFEAGFYAGIELMNGNQK